jgi:hypothetical protein
MIQAEVPGPRLRQLCWLQCAGARHQQQQQQQVVVVVVTTQQEALVCSVGGGSRAQGPGSSPTQQHQPPRLQSRVQGYGKRAAAPALLLLPQDRRPGLHLLVAPHSSQQQQRREGLAGM